MAAAVKLASSPAFAKAAEKVAEQSDTLRTQRQELQTWFAAREEESEGRRRAVALNNMFFSSALASAAMDRTRTWGVAARELVLVNPEDGSDLLFELLSSPVRELTEGTALVSVLRNVTDLGQAWREWTGLPMVFAPAHSVPAIPRTAAVTSSAGRARSG